MKLADSFEEILIIFTKQKVDFLITGGYAVIFHGYGRTTSDLDIWINSTEKNKENLVLAFKEMNFEKKSLNLIEQLEFKKPFSFKVGEEPLAVDIFNYITGVDYNVAYSKAVSYKYTNELEIKFVHLFDLITNKMMTGRLKDQADVEELQKINLYSQDKSIVAYLKKLVVNNRKPRT